MRRTALFSLVLVSALPAAAAGGSPSRAGRVLEAPPLALLAPAASAAPEALEALARHNQEGRLPLQNGFSRSLDAPATVRLTALDLLRPTPFEVAGGIVTRSPDGDLVWRGELAVAAAHALRLHLVDVALPGGSRLRTYAPGGPAVDIDPRSLAGTGGLWTGVTYGDHVVLEVQVPASALPAGAEARFGLDRILEIFPLAPDGSPITGAGPLPKSSHCFVEMACALDEFRSEIGVHRLGIALLLFERNGFSLQCTGGLLADTDPGTERPLFLTAAHCIPDPATAATATAIFRYWNNGCGGPPVFGDQVVGAVLRATAASADSSLLELARLPSKPVFLEWSRATVAPGAVLNLLSHAGGRPQVFSRHQVTPSNRCSHPDRFFETRTVYGGEGPGASGAPVLDSRGRVVGVVSYGCGANPNDGCDPGTAVGFGRFAHAFQSLSSWVDPEPGEETPPEDGFLRTASLPGFKFKVEITAGGETREGVKEEACIPETLCVSGAVAGRSEIFVRIVGPKPNGKLWPTLVKFTTSRVDVTVIQEATGEERRYVLDGAAPGIDELPGLFDRGGFDP